MSIETQVKLRFLSVDFPVVNFQSEKQLLENQEINIDIEPKVFFPKDNKSHFKIIQEVNISVDEVFNLFIVAIGSFELNDVDDEKMKAHFVNMNAPAIMFPYIRSFISTLTSNLGNVTGTLNIPPQFFKGELKQISEEDIIEVNKK
ncbi:MAG: protein-export chaperone SecB [Flavobacterium sp.]|uniref:protein-export chaperone SecB n=1 Tax=Flavobacterium sp. TaxID=239 RepID=UPI0022C67051|nr:protein-export chaperone SecB [Flavobacterium sp.]MCZ8298507.1 protein-export chaperone SecB [Flavobacterium sp.]